MGRARLDPTLLRKIAVKTRVPENSVRVRVSKLASRKGIRSEAALLVLARRHNISIAGPLRRLDSATQQQVSDALDTRTARPSGVSRRASGPESRQAGQHLTLAHLLTDQELRSRCADLLRRKRHQDRAVREALTVLEARLRERTGLGKAQERTRQGLVAKALNPDPNKALIVVSRDNDKQEGVFSICKGLIGAFGNPAHHYLRNDVTREEALAVCGAVNLMLMLIRRGNVRHGTALGGEEPVTADTGVSNAKSFSKT